MLDTDVTDVTDAVTDVEEVLADTLDRATDLAAPIASGAVAAVTWRRLTLALLVAAAIGSVVAVVWRQRAAADLDDPTF